jgi:hypothetical protein
MLNAIPQLQCDSDCKSDGRIPSVVEVVPVVVIVISDVDVIGRVPIVCPVFRPGVHEQERIAAVPETRIPQVDRGTGHSEPVLTPERETEAGLRDVVTAIAPALRPRAMVTVPVLGTILQDCPMPLPSALLLPSPLLLPRECLLGRALRLLCLLDPRWLLLLRPLWLRLLGALLRLWPLWLRLLGALLRLRLLDVLGPLRRLWPLRLRLLGALLRLWPLWLRLLGALLRLWPLWLSLLGALLWLWPLSFRLLGALLRLWPLWLSLWGALLWLSRFCAR